MLKPPDSITRNLIAAKGIISDENNWGCSNAQGKGWNRRDATHLCANFALSKVLGCGGYPEEDCPELIILARAAVEMLPHYCFDPLVKNSQSVWLVNDCQGHAATMRMFDRAIELSLQESVKEMETADCCLLSHQ